MKKVSGYKGFNLDWTCRGYQFEVGKTFEHEGQVEICESGFHACADIRDVWSYYCPAGSRFAEVSGENVSERKSDDSKFACAKITIKSEISLSDMIDLVVAETIAGAKKINGSHATGYQGAASATGYQGAASATGNWSAAMASGRMGKAKASEGSAIFLVERNSDDEIIAVWAGIAGRDGIEPDTYYTLVDGSPEVQK